MEAHGRRPPRAGLPPTVEFEPADGRPDAKGFTLLITVIPSRGDPAFNSPERLKRAAEAQGRGMLSSAKETEIKLEEVKGEKATAYLFTVTDKAPDPGSFEYATAGSAGVGDLLLAVTFLHHEKDSADRRAALQMLKTARQGAGPGRRGGRRRRRRRRRERQRQRRWQRQRRPARGGSGPPSSARVRIGLPGAAWELVLPAGGLTVKADQSDPAGRRRQVMAVDETTGVTVSVFVEPAAKAGGDAKAVRDLYWGRAKQSPLPKSDVKLAEPGDLATVEYLVAEVNGLQLNQRNLNVYAAHAGYWVDVHVSKVRFDEAADRPLFDKIPKG